MDNDFTDSVPLGFGMMLAQNKDALKKFSELTKSEQQKYINGAHSVTSKQEMKNYIDSIGDFM